MSEFELIDIIRRHAGKARSDVRIGIGDDAAVVSVPPGHELAVCTDTLVAGVHFPLSTDPADIGWKALAVNLSDLAAMGAIPTWATLAMTLPEPDSRFVERFMQGFAQLANEYEVALIGGDTTRGPLTLSVTAHGLVPTGRALRRGGAKPGDAVFVTGTLGDAAGGLRLLQSAGQGAENPGQHGQALVARLNRPQARVAAGVALRDLAGACIDVSDGLLADLGHVATSSKLGIEIGEDCLPMSVALQECFDTGTCRELQLFGGDDYELAFTIAEAKVDSLRATMEKLGCRVSRIGRVIEESGIHVLDREGQRRATSIKGWDHFR